jgi:hypothetical protein
MSRKPVEKSPIQFDAQDAATLSFLAKSPASFALVQDWLRNTQALRVARVISGIERNEKDEAIQKTAQFFREWAADFDRTALASSL